MSKSQSIYDKEVKRRLKCKFYRVALIDGMSRITVEAIEAISFEHAIARAREITGENREFKYIDVDYIAPWELGQIKEDRPDAIFYFKSN